MLTVELDREKSIVFVEPHGSLTKEDFENIAKEVDPYIEEKGKLNGIFVHSKTFPGWDSFATFVSHVKFIKNHHQKVSKIAFATDFSGADFVQSIAKHFISAEIKHFAFDDMEEAKNWLEL